MSNLISRQDAIDAVHKYFRDEIKKQPFAVDEDGDEICTDMATVNSLLAHNKALSNKIKRLRSIKSRSDYIKAQTAIDSVADALMEWSDMEEWRDRKVIDAITDAPRSDVRENRTGKWIDMDTASERFIPRYRCSLCGGFGDNTDFCPNCGADMRGGDAE